MNLPSGARCMSYQSPLISSLSTSNLSDKDYPCVIGLMPNLVQRSVDLTNG